MNFQSLINGVAHIGIRVRELSRSRAFYELLGFKFIAGPIGPEPVAILEHPSGVVINFILNASASATENILMDVPEKHPGYTHMALSVTDLDLAHEALLADGISVSEGPIDFPGARALFVRDPDGNVIELNQTVPTA